MVRVLDAAMTRLPEPVRRLLGQHAEMVKFLVVGGSAFVIDTGIFLALKSGALESRPVTAKIISTVTATIYSYVLSRQWSFRTRGGRRGHHEAMLFFLVSGLGIVVNTAPLWLSRYGFDLARPNVSRVTEEVADFVSAQIIGTLLAMVFRWWAFRKFVFPHADVRERPAKSEPARTRSRRRPAAAPEIFTETDAATEIAATTDLTTAAGELAAVGDVSAGDLALPADLTLPEASGLPDDLDPPAGAGRPPAGAAGSGPGEAGPGTTEGAGRTRAEGPRPGRAGDRRRGRKRRDANGRDATRAKSRAERDRASPDGGQGPGNPEASFGVTSMAGVDGIDIAAELLAEPWPLLDEPRR